MAETMANKTTQKVMAVEIEKDEEKKIEIVSQMLEIVNSIDTASAD